jgi:hypothetical protein
MEVKKKMRNERIGNRDKIEKAVEIIQTASEDLEKSICLLRGIIGQMDAAEDYAKFQREQFYVIKDNYSEGYFSEVEEAGK